MLRLIIPTLLCCASSLAAQLGFSEPSSATLSRSALRDKIRGAWAGQMIGVAYGARTEFRSLGQIDEGEIQPAELANALEQDDLYVEMTFAQVMDKLGLDATAADFGAAFQNTTYKLWHANAAARRNLNRGLQAPLCGHPRYNIHADDIDFQIEADFIGIMCPGLPQASNEFCDRVGHVINYGDGVYGGMFVGGMYSAAYFETDPRQVVAAGLACLPAESAYARIIRDVLGWSAEEPSDWRSVWQRVEERWDKDDVCPDGVERPFNIDAKLNGAYIAIGLLYGAGDSQQTAEIATRCGQDSDCNPSSALGILGAMVGFDELPARDRHAIEQLADRKFRHTDYSFSDIVRSTEARTLQLIRRCGGTVSDSEVVIPLQPPRPAAFEQCEFDAPVRVVPTDDPSWQWEGKWTDSSARAGEAAHRSKSSDRPGATATLSFAGTGVALVGDLSADGGRADVYVDGVKTELVADAYVVPHTHDNDLWRIHGLAGGDHLLRLVVRQDADPRSAGRTVSLNRAVIYRAD